MAVAYTLKNPGSAWVGTASAWIPFLVEATPALTPLIKTARQVNDSQPHFVLDLIRRTLGELGGKRVAVLGLAYIADVDDLRESPAVEIARLLVEAEALVKAYEPFKPGANLEGVPTVPTLDAAVGDADALVLLVGHKVFRELKPDDVAKLTPARVVVDVWGIDEWRENRYQMVGLGNATLDEVPQLFS